MQTITPSWLVRFFGLAEFQTISFDKNNITIVDKNKTVSIDIETIHNYQIKKSLFANTFTVSLKNGTTYKINGFPGGEIGEFITKLDKRLAESYYAYYYAIASDIDKDIPGKNVYWRKQAFRDICKKISIEFKEYKELSVAPSQEQKSKFDVIRSISLEDESIREKHNSKFIEYEKREYKHFFDSVESNPLTDRQKDAVITYEKNSLVIAGAGSGKTSVMVAKAGYLTQRYGVDPSKILLLAFNKKASIELKERIREKLGMEMDSLTFHALGLSIIGEVDDAKPSLGPWAEDDKKMNNLLQELIDNLLATDEVFSHKLMDYFQRLFYTYKSEFDFETKGDYIDYVKSIELRTLNGDKVKSYEECEIANFLFMNQISYQYEARYEHNTASKDYRQYQPDFFLPDYGIYIEHFGVDKDGNTAPFVYTKEYHEGMVWKRALHRHYGTKLVETYSCEKQKGVLTTRLKEKLGLLGVEFNSIPVEDALRIFNESGMTNAFVKLCSVFLSNYKSNNHTFNALAAKIETLKDPERALAFLELFSKIIGAYEEYQKAQGMIDFNDMINIAVSYIKRGKYRSKYTHILVDEFQDISTTRAEMVKQLVAQNEDSSLCVVGDDWQSINRFAGSDISIVRNFQSIYGDSETINLDYTFRYNNEISKVSQSFIERNPNQITKSIKTVRETKDKALFIWWDSIDVLESIRAMLGTISQKRAGEQVSLFVLARFWHIIPDGINSLNNLYPNITVTPLSVHASKGLEADYVVILGNEAGKFGFPSSMEDDPIIDLVLAESEEYPFAEERRLFYVAMTRAKDEVHFFASQTNRSLFIEELLKENKESIEEIGAVSQEQESCKKCTTGKLVKRKTKESGKFFLGCSNYPYCDYVRKISYCKKCGEGTMIKDESDGIYKCSNISCDNTLPICQECGAVMVERRGPYGLFFGCSNYPKCNYILKPDCV